MMPKQKYYN